MPYELIFNPDFEREILCGGCGKRIEEITVHTSVVVFVHVDILRGWVNRVIVDDGAIDKQNVDAYCSDCGHEVSGEDREDTLAIFRDDALEWPAWRFGV